MKDLKEGIRDVVDFPRKGIHFKDITPLIKDRELFKLAIDEMAEKLKKIDFDLIVASESRGFLFGAPLAYTLNKGLVIARKKGKLPSETVQETYNLEYGTATLEIHKDAIEDNQKVVIVDDLLGTGGTSKAMVNLVEKLHGKVVLLSFLIELTYLKGREKLCGYDVESVIQFNEE